MVPVRRLGPLSHVLDLDDHRLVLVHGPLVLHRGLDGLLEIVHIRNVIVDSVKLEQRSRLSRQGRHLDCCLDVNLRLGLCLVSEAWDQEQGRGQQEDHQGGAGLSLSQTSVDDNLMKSSQLGCQGLVLTLKSLDLVLNRIEW